MAVRKWHCETCDKAYRWRLSAQRCEARHEDEYDMDEARALLATMRSIDKGYATGGLVTEPIHISGGGCNVSFPFPKQEEFDKLVEFLKKQGVPEE